MLLNPVVSQRRQRAKWTTELRRGALALAGLLLSVAILAGAAQANARYFYCEAMGLLDVDPCAAAQAGEDDGADVGRSAEARPGDCCTVVALASMPEGAPMATPALPQRALTAILPVATELHARDANPRPRPVESRERWRVPPRCAGELRAQLMVFLT